MNFQHNHLGLQHVLSLLRTPGLLLPLFLFLLSGCGANMPDSPKHRFVLMLVDETGSFQMKNGTETTEFWPEVLRWAGKCVKNLEAGDGFGVIGIDDHGFDLDDVRIPMSVLAENPLTAVQQKRTLSKKVEKLVRRKNKRPYSDILGAVYHAAYFLNREKGAYQPVLIIFSDMIQTPKWPTKVESADLKFPLGTEIHCFYVDATGRNKWEEILRVWVPIFQNAGVNVTEKQFFQRGEINRGMLALMPNNFGH